MKKKYELNNSYFKNRRPNMPDTILEIAKYYKENSELPFNYSGDNWVYDAFCERQKRKGVYNSQFLTPDATADRMMDFALYRFPNSVEALDACCGTGQITKELIKSGFRVKAFDSDLEMAGVCKLINDSSLLDVFRADFREVTFAANQIIANPPYEVAELTDFLEWILSVQDSGIGISILLLPKGFIDKNKPKRIVEILKQFSCIDREDMREEFKMTKINAEIVVLKKI